MNPNLIGIAGHLTRLESQTGFRMTGNEGTVAIFLLIFLILILIGRAATRPS